jgi:SAM-dependent methyltransferase
MHSDTFNSVAELYDRARPGYPAELVDALTDAATLNADSRILEIAPGTGQLTVPLARLGCRITAVEKGASLAAVARRNLREYPRTTVEVSAFEDWPLPADPFALVVCATAFHWLDPAVRVVKSADALADGGTFAVITTAHIEGGTRAFFSEVQRCYERWDPSTPRDLPPSEASPAPGITGELDASGRFGPATVNHFEREITYTTSEYLEVLNTYSGHRLLAPAARTGLLNDITHLINGSHGGTVTKRYAHELVTAVVKPPNREGTR